MDPRKTAAVKTMMTRIACTEFITIATIIVGAAKFDSWEK